MNTSPTDASPLVRGLVAWYDRAKRDMPWRNTRDPYAIWVSETMLQQTQVATVIPYYHRFLKAFPTAAALAQADLSQVLSLWAGLGYYRRAKHLHAGAKEVLTRHGGEVPGSFDQLLALPGIGRYTAGAIGSIAFNLAVPVVDGNVMRVLARVYAYEQDIALPKNHAFFWEKAQAWVNAAPRFGGCAKSQPRFGDVNQAIMELGATLCTPVNPQCPVCPLQEACAARRQNRQTELPVKTAKKATPVVRRVALVILRNDPEDDRQVLLMERPAGGLWEHMLEFPTICNPSKLRSTAAKVRAAAEEALGIPLDAPRTCRPVSHQLTHRLMQYDVLTALAHHDPHRLPACDSGEHYVTSKWVAWPLEEQLPIAQAVRKIASSAQAALTSEPPKIRPARRSPPPTPTHQ